MNLGAISVVVALTWLSPALFADEQAEEDSGGKILPLPIIITEPAIGEGLGAALIYFHGDPVEDAPTVSSPNSLKKTSREQTPPPTATG